VLKFGLTMLLGLYVQVPFCQTKCTYCNFHTGVFSNDLYAPYVEAVSREIAEYPCLLREFHIAEVPEPVVDTAYFGGGERQACLIRRVWRESSMPCVPDSNANSKRSPSKPIQKRSSLRRPPHGARLDSIASAWGCNPFRTMN